MGSRRPPTQSRRDVAGASASGDPDLQPSEGKRLDRILVATDGSPASEHAIRFAVQLASEYQSEVLFVHVIPSADMFAASGSDEVGAAAPHESAEGDQALLADAAALASEHGVAAKSTLLVGSTAAEILAYAESHDVNMIVVGSRGHGAAGSALLGSVSLNVLRASERPLVIVDGENSITYCGNASCRDVRTFGHSETDEASSPVRPHVRETLGLGREAFMTNIERSHTRVTSRLPDTVAHSTNTGQGSHLAPGSGRASARGTPPRMTERVPSLLGLLSGAIRLETVVFLQDDAWAITATIPYEGVIMLAEFTTRDSASEWFAIADTLVAS